MKSSMTEYGYRKDELILLLLASNADEAQVALRDAYRKTLDANNEAKAKARTFEEKRQLHDERAALTVEYAAALDRMKRATA